MQYKNIKTLALVFAVLLLAVISPIFVNYVKNFVSTKQENSKSNKVFSKINFDNLNKVTVSSKDGNVELTKEGTQWKVNGKKADQAKMSDLISKATDSKIIEVV